MKYAHVIAAIVSAFLAYPVYLRHGLWWAVVAVAGMVGNFIIAVLEIGKPRPVRSRRDEKCIGGNALNEREKQIINAMVLCDMNVLRVSRKLYMHRNTVEYWLAQIHSKTGLNPKVFLDLEKLKEMISVADPSHESKLKGNERNA